MRNKVIIRLTDIEMERVRALAAVLGKGEKEAIRVALSMTHQLLAAQAKKKDAAHVQETVLPSSEQAE